MSSQSVPEACVHECKSLAFLHPVEYGTAPFSDLLLEVYKL